MAFDSKYLGLVMKSTPNIKLRGGKLRTGLKGRRGPWQFLDFLTCENYRESMLHNIKENGLQDLLNWGNMAFNVQWDCLNTGKLLHCIKRYYTLTKLR